MKLAPVPVAGVPPGADHENVYGAVPPVAEAVKVTAVPTVPVAGPEMLTASVTGLTVMLAVFEAWAPLVSVTVALTV